MRNKNLIRVVSEKGGKKGQYYSIQKKIVENFQIPRNLPVGHAQLASNWNAMLSRNIIKQKKNLPPYTHKKPVNSPCFSPHPLFWTEKTLNLHSTDFWRSGVSRYLLSGVFEWVWIKETMRYFPTNIYIFILLPIRRKFDLTQRISSWRTHERESKEKRNKEKKKTKIWIFVRVD